MTDQTAANPDATNPDAANPDAPNPDAANPDALTPDASFNPVPVASVAPETFLDAIIAYPDGSPVRDFTDRLTAYAQAGLMGATVIPIGVAYHVADDGG